MEILRDKIAAQIESYLEDLKAFTSTPHEGVTRLPFTNEAKQTTTYLSQGMEELGLKTRVDASGAVIGRLEGKNKETIIIGSHYDSVRYGGAYDGIAGVICGIEVARLFIENNITPHYSVEVIGTNDEEGARFKSGFFSSKAMLGELKTEELKRLKDAEGISIYEAMLAYGLKPERLIDAKRDLKEIKGFIEIHIEQGPILEEYHKEIGIVDTIVGMHRYMVAINGRADHAGTTPMYMRSDAMEAASKMIAPIGDYARVHKDAVATVGHIKAFPNEINTIANKVAFSVDIRCTAQRSVEAIYQQISTHIEQVSKACSVTYSIERTMSVSPVHMDNCLKQKIEESCKKRGYPYQHLNSGAGHDSLPLANKIKTAMIFVPSKKGRSHCVEEFSECEHLAKATIVAFDAIRGIE